MIDDVDLIIYDHDFCNKSNRATDLHAYLGRQLRYKIGAYSSAVVIPPIRIQQIDSTNQIQAIRTAEIV